MFDQNYNDFIATAKSAGFDLAVIESILALFGGYEAFTEFCESIRFQVFLTSLARIEPSHITEDDYPRDSTTIINTVIDDIDVKKEDLYKLYEEQTSNIRDSIVGNNEFRGAATKTHMERFAAYMPDKIQSLFLCGVYDIEAELDDIYDDYYQNDLKMDIACYVIYLLSYEYLRQVGGLDSSLILEVDLSSVNHITCESASVCINTNPSNKDCRFSFGPENSSMHDALEAYSFEFTFDEDTIETKNPVINGITILRRYNDFKQTSFPEVIKLKTKELSSIFASGESLVEADITDKKNPWLCVFMSDKSVASMNIDVDQIEVDISDDSILTLSGEVERNTYDQSVADNATLIATNLKPKQSIHWHLRNNAKAMFSSPEMHAVIYLKDEAKYFNSKVKEVIFPYRGCTTEQITKAKAKK